MAKGKQVYNISAEGVTDGCLIDSAADIYVSGDNPNFTLETVLTKPPILHLALSGTYTHLRGIGSMKIPTPSGIMAIENVYYCKDIWSTIICLEHLIKGGYCPIFNSTSLSLVSPTNILFTTSYVNRCWYLDKLPMQVNAISEIPLPGARAWHECLGHASNSVIKLFLKHFVPNSNANNWQDVFCKSCTFSKSVKQGNSPTINLKVSEPLDLLVSDVIGPFDRDPEGNRLILTLRNNASTYTFTSALKSRADVSEKIMFWVKFLFNLLHKYPERFRSNNAGEYSGRLARELGTFGIKWIPTEPYFPDQNGEAERLNRTIGDMARTMLHFSKLPATLWRFEYSCATHVHNRLPKKRVALLTPMETLFNIQPNPDQLFPFGARAIVHVPPERHTKLDARETECILLAYQKSGKALKSNLSVHWRTAAEAELQQFEERGVWEAVSPTANMEVLRAKWVFAVKQTASGQIERFKARYFARGFSQKPRIDCSDVYAPTASLNSLRLLLELKVKFNLHMAGFNVNAAYLYSPIEGDVFVQAPVEL
ncbi:hypothetical protein O181_087037 [Austropuccinia psidii MF-1]|uniref:Integrase catalytic domain-containing protein n=1 Tax=Austropuccinia psidii MF-1 TaxID=1389203 RepID=A0A9Q3INX6_9BASI|nr:hypothetical protein [Austropuccinia psidii MF-1]